MHSTLDFHPAAPTGLTSRGRFLAALRCQPVDRPPFWLMRQAGRCLPEYRKLRQQFTFRELITIPELAAEVTLQPVRRFGFDAAILFSDILVVPEALGHPFRFVETGGVRLDPPLRNVEDIERLEVHAVRDRLGGVREIIRRIRGGLREGGALLGFAGSPWTLANFMLEGGSNPHPTKALELLRENPDAFHKLAWALTLAVTEFLQLQIDAGVDAIQIFDSLGGLAPDAEFEAASGTWMQAIIENLFGQVPVIVFSKGTREWEALANTGANGFGIDHETDLLHAREALPEEVAIQGNLAPSLLQTASADQVAVHTASMLRSMSGRAGYIFNLGHGVPPNARLENLAALAETVRNHQP